MMQNKEDIIFSRIQQLDSLFVREIFIFTKNETSEKPRIENEEQAAKYLANYLLYFLSIASDNIKQNYKLLTNDRRSTLAVIPFLETLLMVLSYIGKSGKCFL